MKIEYYGFEHSNFPFKYVVICTRYGDKWMFVRHKQRTTWEIPGGHIEPGETVADAADRELREETGAVKYSLQAVCNYSVKNEQGTGYGRLYFAQVTEYRETYEHEIGEIILRDTLPENLTHALIQPYLFEKVRQLIGI